MTDDFGAADRLVDEVLRAARSGELDALVEELTEGRRRRQAVGSKPPATGEPPARRPLAGYRCWAADSSCWPWRRPALWATATETEWYEGPQEASCLVGRRHTVPDPGCVCGFYACDSLASARRFARTRYWPGEARLTGRLVVFGVVKMWGAGTLVDEVRGRPMLQIRARHAQIVALLDDGSRNVLRLADDLGVPALKESWLESFVSEMGLQRLQRLQRLQAPAAQRRDPERPRRQGLLRRFAAFRRGAAWRRSATHVLGVVWGAVTAVMAAPVTFMLRSPFPGFLLVFGTLSTVIYAPASVRCLPALASAGAWLAALVYGARPGAGWIKPNTFLGGLVIVAALLVVARGGL